MYTHIAIILPSLQVVCFLNKQKIVGSSYRNVQEATRTVPPPVLTSCLPNVPHGNQVSVVGAGHRAYSEFTVLHGFTYIRVCTVALYHFQRFWELELLCILTSTWYYIVRSLYFSGFFSNQLGRCRVESHCRSIFYIFGHILGHVAS